MFARTSFYLIFIISFCAISRPVAADPMTISSDKDYKQYTDFFEKVYKTFEENYYLPPDRKIYEHFLKKLIAIFMPN